MRLLDDGLAFDPHLLPGWESLHFAVEWRGRRLEVTVMPAETRFRLASGSDVDAGRACEPKAGAREDWGVQTVGERSGKDDHGPDHG